jgi:repressor LexA
MSELTKRQTEVLHALKQFIDAHGYSPTVRELGKLLQVDSPSSIFKHLKSLEMKGKIRQSEKRARSIELQSNEQVHHSGKTVTVIGSIAAQERVEFFTKLHEASFPEQLLQKPPENYYAFFIKDKSFHEMALTAGDIVAIETRTEVLNREVVLATDTQMRALIGIYSKEKQGCKIGDRSFLEHEIKILGVLAALIRSY